MTENLIQNSSGTSWSDWQGSTRLANTPWTSADQLCPAGARLIVVAPHPDDEILMCGGLLSGFRGREHGLLMVSVTDGEGSHPDSNRWSPQRLRERRPQESRDALQRLGLNVDVVAWQRLSLQDGAVARDERALVNHLCQSLAPQDRLLTTWRGDGHCDHEAVGRASAQAARAVGARLIELPVWTWHWATPEDPRVPWHRAHKIALAPAAVARKRHALHAFTSQLEGDPQIDLPPVLPPHVLERLLQPFEVVFV